MNRWRVKTPHGERKVSRRPDRYLATLIAQLIMEGYRGPGVE